jgi:hypothetical protein
MKRIVEMVLTATLLTLLQSCATSGTAPDVQSPGAPGGNTTGQNMDYMYRSPSSQIGYL